MNEERNNLINQIFDVLSYKYDDNDPDIQEKYFYMLDKIIDAVCNLRYSEEKKNSLFYSIDQLNDVIMEQFMKIDDFNRNFILSSLTIKISSIIKINRKNDGYIDLQKKIDNLYNIYINGDGHLDKENTTDFYNEILNKQQDAFIKEEKQKIIKSLMYKLTLTEKEQQKIIKALKLKEAYKLLKEENYRVLKISPNILQNKLCEVHENLNKIKEFEKNNIIITKQQFMTLDNLFLNGDLSFETVESNNMLTNLTKKQIKIILKKYNKLLLPYLDNIELDINSADLPKDNINYNYNHVKITNKDTYYTNLKELVSTMNNDEITFFIKNYNNIKDLLSLLPLANLLEEFDVKILKSIIFNYDKIREKLKIDLSKENKITFTKMLNNLTEYIKLAESYNSADEYTISILGEERIQKILKEKQTSRNPAKYVDAYIKMLNCNKSSIPPINGEYNDYIYETGNNYDLDKLLIGKNCHRSCVGPSGAGENAFYACLSDKDADVLIIKRKKSNEFIGRILMFRKGNYILFSPIQGIKGIDRKLYDIGFLTHISNQIFDKIDLKNDKLDYIFLTNNYLNILKDVSVYTNGVITQELPHADLSSNVFVIGNKTFKNTINIDINQMVKPLYYKTRKKVEEKTVGFLDDIKRIKALDINMTMGENMRKNKMLEFENLQQSNYKKAYIGQDYYILIKNNGQVDKTILNTNDERQNIEINEIVNNILMDEGNDKNIDNYYRKNSLK